MSSVAATPVNLQEEYAKTEISKILNILDEELVGLAPVKGRIREIAALLLIDKLRKNLGITAGSPGLHMSFTGSPGTGKTTVVLPVPGLPVKDICNPGLFAVIPKFFLNLSINNNAAISRIRAFTGARPTNSSSSKFKSFAISVLAYSSCKLMEFIIISNRK